MLSVDVAPREETTTSLKTPLILSKICLPLMVIQSVIGLVVPGMYIKDGQWGRPVWLGNDFINLFPFTPLLVIAIILARRGSDKGRLFWLGIQALITYDYVYYPLAVAYNKFFLLYLAVFGVALYSFIFGITKIDFSRYERHIPGKGSRIAASLFMLAFALVLSGMWIGQSVMYLFTGEVKQQGISLIATLDLIILVTPILLSTIWLLRREARGYVLMTVLSLVCGCYCFILMAYTPFALKFGNPDAWTMLPVWIILWVLSLPASVILLGIRQRA